MGNRWGEEVRDVKSNTRDSLCICCATKRMEKKGAKGTQKKKSPINSIRKRHRGGQSKKATRTAASLMWSNPGTSTLPW